MANGQLTSANGLDTVVEPGPDGQRTLSGGSAHGQSRVSGMGNQGSYEQRDLREAVGSFMLAQQAYRRSPSTIAAYRRAFDGFGNFFERQFGRVPQVADLTPEIGRHYLVHLQRRVRYEDHPSRRPGGRLSPATINQETRCLRAFANWLHKESWTPTHQLFRLELPRVPLREIKPLSRSEVGRILQMLDTGFARDRRLAAMVAALYDTGMRSSELAGLRLNDIRYETGEIGVFGKGSKERTVVAGRQTLRLILRYIDCRPEGLGKAVDRVFLTRTGRPLNKNGISRIFSRLRDRCGIPRVHAHLLRHSFAVQFLRNSGDVLTLQRLMGHASIASTNRYVSLANADLVNVHRRASPLDNEE
jgi:site-specific recombinase XerD